MNPNLFLSNNFQYKEIILKKWKKMLRSFSHSIRSICTQCNQDKLCLSTYLQFEKNEINIKKINSCKDCVYYVLPKGEKIGYCKNIRIEKPISKKNIYMDVITSRMYHDLCAPCGKYFIPKK